MKRLILEPNGWECTLGECLAGLFVFDDSICFKTEYRTENGDMEVYCESGEVFIGSSNSKEERDNLIVQPVVVHWDYYDEI